MGTATAGFSADFEYSEDDSTYNSIGSANSGDFNLNRAELDSTEFGEESMDRIYGLLDSGGSVTGKYDHSDTAQAAIVAAIIAGTEAFMQVTYDGTNGLKAPVLITEFSLSTAVDGTTDFSLSFVGRGTPSVVS